MTLAARREATESERERKTDAGGGGDYIDSNVSPTWIAVTMAALEMQPAFPPPHPISQIHPLLLTDRMWESLGMSERFFFLEHGLRARKPEVEK